MERAERDARLAVDIGGTFTDIVVEAAGRRTTAKVLTTPRAPEEGVLEGVDRVLAEAGIAPAEIGLVIHGTTLATNAIIERKGAVTALIVTEGFRDTLEIAYEDRYDQYDVFLEKPRPLVPRRLRLPVPERLDVSGEVLRPLDAAAVEALVPRLREAGVESVAVGFLHSYANPVHERAVRDILAAALPDLSITLSCEVCPEIREYERLSTAVANAYVQPLMARYLGRLDAALRARGFAAPLLLMTSGGGLTTLETAVRFPVRLVESGPAGGAILAAHVAAECGLDRVVSFDMGGTTAKICLIADGRPETARVFEVDRAARFLKGSGLPLRIPSIEMVEIGAGGGSYARVDALGRVAVGPESAGSEPGPACYGRGGEGATVTDADLVLGRIDPGRFAGGRIALAPGLAEAAIEAAVGRPLGLEVPLAAYAIAEMVDENMANAARVHAVERGRVLGEHALIAFGGAAPLHACRIAEKLGIDRVLVPADAGVGSAVGFLRAPVAYEVVRSRYATLGAFDPEAANALLAEMAAEARAVVAPAAGPEARLEETRLAFMRYVGQGHELAVPLPVAPFGADGAEVLRAAFDRAYVAVYGRVIPDAEIEVLTWSLSLRTAAEPPAPVAVAAGGRAATPAGRRAVLDPESGRAREVPLYLRGDLAPGDALSGPALIAEEATATFVADGFEASLLADRTILLLRRAAAAAGDRDDHAPDREAAQ